MNCIHKLLFWLIAEYIVYNFVKSIYMTNVYTYTYILTLVPYTSSSWFVCSAEVKIPLGYNNFNPSEINLSN